VFIDDLEVFIKRPVRSLGEMYAVLERGVLKQCVDAFRRCQDFTIAEGVENSDLSAHFYAKVDAMVQGVERAAAIQDNGGGGSIPAPHTPNGAHSHNNGGFGRGGGGGGMGSMPGTVSIPHLKVRPTSPTVACRARHVRHMSREYSQLIPVLT
jgi:hypothetical protein